MGCGCEVDLVVEDLRMVQVEQARRYEHFLGRYLVQSEVS